MFDVVALLQRLLVAGAAFALAVACMRLLFQRRRPKRPTVGFFHPYCNDGGGGERVLWQMVKSIRVAHPKFSCVVFSGDVTASPEQILAKVRGRFGIDLTAADVSFVFLRTRGCVEARYYPVCTMLGQSLGAVVMALEALQLCNPHVLLDTMGYSFALPVFHYLGRCWTGCYVHYPTISVDMLQAVAEGRSAHNNRALFNLPLLRAAKLRYYRLFAALYGVMGRAAHLVMTNSSWTRGNIEQLWPRCRLVTSTLFPPCNVAHLVLSPLEGRDRNLIVSIAQFRPEKDQALQIRALARLLARRREDFPSLRLVLIGSCRHADDEALVAGLRSLASELGVAEHVQFEVNASYPALLGWLAKAQYGVHSMWCEHFGIGIVELLAAGLAVVAHNSGGPKMDIVVPWEGQETGRLASTEEEYASQLEALLDMPAADLLQLQRAARASTARFSDEQFTADFLDTVRPLLKQVKRRI